MKISQIYFYSIFALLSFSSIAQASQDDWPEIVSRCSHASKVVVDGYAKFDDESQQSKFVANIFKRLRESRQLGAQTPDEIDEFWATVAIKNLVRRGVNLRTQRDWALTQVSGSCSLKRFEGEQYRAQNESSKENHVCENKYSLGYSAEKCENHLSSR